MDFYLQENDERVNFEVREVQKVDLDIFSEGTRKTLKPNERKEQYNLSSNQNTTQNCSIFVTLGKISDQEEYK